MALKDIKENYIVDCAKDLFLNNSINTITMEQVALKADIGNATLYRYFENKNILALKVMIKVLNDIFSEFKIDDDTINPIRDFYYIFLKVYNKNKKYYSLVYEFDLLCKTNQIIDFKCYLDAFDNLYLQYKKWYLKGLNRGIYKEISDLELFYYTTCHSLLNLCKHLAYEVDLEKKVKDICEIEMLINVFLTQLERKN